MSSIRPDSEENLTRIFIQDSSSSVGAGLTGLAYDTVGLICGRYRTDLGAGTVNLAPMTAGTWVSGGFVELDSVNLPGIYEFGIPNSLAVDGFLTWCKVDVDLNCLALSGPQ